MAYQDYHWNQYGVTCTSDSVWVPGTGGGDVNDGTRDQITNAYYSLFGRYGELYGIEFYVSSWVYGNDSAAFGTILNMVKNGGDITVGGSGEWNNVQNIGRHTGLAPGFCPTPPPPPPPPPILRPHVNINGSWYRAKDVYIKDAGSWKLCKSAYIKDNGEWKPFIQY